MTVELKKCQSCSNVFDSDEYRCTSCGNSNVTTESLTRILNWLQSEINYIHQNKADKEIEKID